MRKIEILFLASLALGGYRGILTPNGVFALQTLALFLLIAFKFKTRQFARTPRPFDLLFILIFSVYIILRSTVDLFNQAVTLENVFDFIKPIIVISCLSLSLFRFQLVDDLCDPLTNRRHLTHWIVVFGAVSTLYILGLHVVSMRVGRLDGGLYFSTLYVFASLLLFASLLSNRTLFSMSKDVGMSMALVLRLFMDLRRTPVVVVGGFVVSYLLLKFFRTMLGMSKQQKLSVTSKLIRMVILVIIVAGVYWFIANGNFSRLNLKSLQFALYDVRILDVKLAVDEVLSNDPFFGLGPVFSLNLHYSAQVHSLPAAIFVSYGGIGFFLYLILAIRLIIITIVAFTKRHDVAEAKFSFLLASLFYLLFFTLSARGFEIESFSMFAFALAIGMKKT